MARMRIAERPMVLRGKLAVDAARRGAPLLVETLAGDWVGGGPGALERAQRFEHEASLWGYGVLASEWAKVTPLATCVKVWDGVRYRTLRGTL